MKEIRGKKYYYPKEIAKLGLIKNSLESDKVLSNYEYILRLIKTGHLEARRWGHARKYYIVSEDAIAKYNSTMLLN